MNRNTTLASAIALVLGGATAAHAVPTTAQCAAPQNGLFVAGSSAAQNAFANALATDLFGGAANEVTYSGSNGNFKAYCGFAASGNTAGVTPGNIVTIHYRGEGGSVVGALPIVSGKAIKFLDLSSAPANGGATSVTVVTTGTSASNGTTDSWGGALISHNVEVGITDVEPAQFHDANYPSAYSASAFGSASPSQLAGLTKALLFQQVFGLFVNTTGINGGGAGQTVNIGKDTAANILSGQYTDWANVPQYGTNAPVSSTSQPITLVNREAGSGSRAGASIYFLNYGCPNTGLAIVDKTPVNDGYATGDVLTTANAASGAITYASIDNNNAKPNLTMVSIGGVTPSNLNSALGGYGWFFEATMIKGSISSPGGAGLYNWLSTGELSSVATGPHLADNNAIAGLVGANTATIPLTSNSLGGKTIYVSDFSRGGNSCTLPVEQN